MSCSSDKSFTQALTDSEIDKIYGDGNNPGLLPSSLNNADIENGTLKPSVVNSIILNLKNSGEISINEEKQKKLIENVKSEYCFYYARYRYILDKCFTFLSKNDITIQNNKTTLIQYITKAEMLNSKIVCLTEIINGVTAEFIKIKTSNETEIKLFNEEIKINQNKLIEQNKIISSNQSIAQLNKEMVKYTEEKNRYTDNLLKVYSVLNIIVLGLLVYVYKSVD